jgi:hypothetical protein
MVSRSTSRMCRYPRYKVFAIMASVKLVDYRRLTFQWRGKQTRLFLEPGRPLPVVRYQLDHERATQLQQRFEQHIPDTLITEAWKEFLSTIKELEL